MVEVLNTSAKYANGFNWIDAHFESVPESKFTKSKTGSLAADQNESLS